MTVDHYAGAATGWAEGAAIVYAPIARELVASSPHDLRDRTVLDAGAGTGVASEALRRYGARVVALDRSEDMVAWHAAQRPPAVVADATALPLRSDSVDDTVAAFVLNHLDKPLEALRELVRVTRPGGAVVACVFATRSFSAAREAVDVAARAEGWQVPGWYLDLKQSVLPILGTAEAMAGTARAAGLVRVVADERPVDVRVETAERLVDYRLGQAQFAPWVAELGPRRTTAVKARLVEKVRPVMTPYRPLVVFLSALVPTSSTKDHRR